MSSPINQMRLNMLDTSQSSYFNNANKSTKLENLSDEKDETYYKAYETALSFVKDEVQSYDEYMKYCEENAVSEYHENPSEIFLQQVYDSEKQIQSIRPINMNKVALEYNAKLNSKSIIEGKA